jgi:hypothetical protein
VWKKLSEIVDMNELRIKRGLEINRIFILRALLCFLIFFSALLAMFIWNKGMLFTLRHLFIFSLFFIPFSILCAYTVERLGIYLGGILSFWSSEKVSPQEQLSADLEKARHSKRKDRFEDALNIINDVLNKDADFPDALFLKAQILWEGFGKTVESKTLFRRVMQVVASDDHLYRWSSDYIDQITRKDKERADGFLSDQRKTL